MKLSDLFTALGIAPKTLPQAKETIDTTKATLDSVAALFTAAGLNLEQMLEAGPDSLKAHLELIDTSAELTEALAANDALTAEKASLGETLVQRDSTLLACTEAFTAIGLAGITNRTPGAEVKSAFDAHVAKQVTLANAKIGHPAPVAIVDDITPAKTASAVSDAQILADYEKLIVACNTADDSGDKAKVREANKARAEFAKKHIEAINRAVASRNRNR